MDIDSFTCWKFLLIVFLKRFDARTSDWTKKFSLEDFELWHGIHEIKQHLLVTSVIQNRGNIILKKSTVFCRRWNLSFLRKHTEKQFSIYVS